MPSLQRLCCQLGTWCSWSSWAHCRCQRCKLGIVAPRGIFKGGGGVSAHHAWSGVPALKHTGALQRSSKVAAAVAAVAVARGCANLARAVGRAAGAAACLAWTVRPGEAVCPTHPKSRQPKMSVRYPWSGLSVLGALRRACARSAARAERSRRAGWDGCVAAKVRHCDASENWTARRHYCQPVEKNTRTCTRGA